MTMNIPHYFQVLDLFYFHLSRQFPLSLTLPGREQCHHRPIRQLWLLPDVCPFVTRAMEELAIRSHYCL